MLDYIPAALTALQVEISTLRTDPCNARKHDARNIDAIAASLKRFGQQKPIVLYPDGLTVLAGSGTLIAAVQLGWKFIAAAVSTLEGPEARAFGVADNRSAELAEWDYDTLTELLGVLGSTEKAPAAELGWTPEELKSLVATDWTPGEAGEMPVREEKTTPATEATASPGESSDGFGAGTTGPRTLTVSSAEYAVLGQAIAMVRWPERAADQPPPNEIEALTRIVTEWLEGTNA